MSNIKIALAIKEISTQSCSSWHTISECLYARGVISSKEKDCIEEYFFSEEDASE